MARHWIDGAWLESELVADSYNPATGELLGRFADGGEAEARAAVDAARRAFAGTDWGRDRALRSRALLELAERFEARASELALMLTRENGKTLAEATGEVGAPAATLRHNAAQALTEVGTAAEVAPGQYFSSLAEPVGVVAIIVPWNAPVALFIRSLAPALAAGNTVAAKLPGQTALTNALIAEIVSQARSLPAGVVNMFTESGNTGAPFLIESADVDMVSFTGSIEVGRQIAAAGAKTLKRMNLELGGKTPMIVFDDAALASTLPLLAAGVTTFAGQNCMAGSRILVQRGIADQVREHLEQRLTHVVVGPGEEKNSRDGTPDRHRCRGTCRSDRRGLGQLRQGDRSRRTRHRRTASLRRLLPAQPDRSRGPRAHRSSSKKSSGRSPHSRSSTTRTTPSTGLTRPSSAWPQPCSPAMSTVPAA